MVYWFGEKLCDAGFVINLEERKDRIDRCLKHLELAGFYGVERFNACKIYEENFTKYGCTQSHIEIAKKQIENNWEYVLYLEDDIISDYYYGSEIREDQINKKLVAHSLINELNNKKPDVLFLGVRPEENTEYISNFMAKPNKTLMSHAYVGSLKFAKFLIDNLKFKEENHFSTGYPIDFFISQINVKNDWRIDVFDKENIMKNNDLRIYMSVPMIFNQGNSFSDLLDKEVSYETWVKGCYDTYVNIKKLNINPLLYE